MSGGTPSSRPSVPSALRHSKVGVPLSPIAAAAAILPCSFAGGIRRGVPVV